ncbi:histone-like nucleoid-structuring protein Lsr2 [Gordonia sihwensis]|uniref:histone-like nucleoid-structuring protein Lsr2 n=1 Tax=Gordonia sihwensis TaxID=173559 RepID=UPI003D964B27
MGQKTIVQFFDDLTGEALDPDEVVREEFTFEGVDRILEGSQSSIDQFKLAVAPFADKAGKVKATRRSTRKGTDSGVSSREVRAWCAEQGIEVNDRGRIPKEIIAKFKEAN